jgi:hypothetical protein
MSQRRLLLLEQVAAQLLLLKFCLRARTHKEAAEVDVALPTMLLLLLYWLLLCCTAAAAGALAAE